jgi:hypothetical protein
MKPANIQNRTMTTAFNNTTSTLPSTTHNNTPCISLRVIFCVIAFLAVFGNLMVVAVLVKNRILRRHASAVVILSLAITDMLTGKQKQELKNRFG